ncbi:hypothetical protein CP8484711_0010A, partial [Chlamydia psittaci 84-8471/1]
MPWV